ncbi:hypothetical protein FF2_013563 [Malus domestica]
MCLRQWILSPHPHPIPAHLKKKKTREQPRSHTPPRETYTPYDHPPTQIPLPPPGAKPISPPNRKDVILLRIIFVVEYDNEQEQQGDDEKSPVNDEIGW